MLFNTIFTFSAATIFFVIYLFINNWLIEPSTKSRCFLFSFVVLRISFRQILILLFDSLLKHVSNAYFTIYKKKERKKIGRICDRKTLISTQIHYRLDFSLSLTLYAHLCIVRAVIVSILSPFAWTLFAFIVSSEEQNTKKIPNEKH